MSAVERHRFLRRCFTILQGGAIALTVALKHADMFAGLVLVAPALIICPRWLSTSLSTVTTTFILLRMFLDNYAAKQKAVISTRFLSQYF